MPGVIVRVRPVEGWQLKLLVEYFGFRISKWVSVGLALVISCAGPCLGLLKPFPISYIDYVLKSGLTFSMSF